MLFGHLYVVFKKFNCIYSKNAEILSILQAHELFELAFLEQTSVLMILLPLITFKPERNGPPPVLEAKLEKMALRIFLCIQDALEVADKWELDGFADRT